MEGVKFPSPLGVIFSLIIDGYVGGWIDGDSFRLLSELYSLLFNTYHTECFIKEQVSVSSRSYILSYIDLNPFYQRDLVWVSVSSRSYILSYNNSNFLTIFDRNKVSVSSRSYILSYKTQELWIRIENKEVSVSSRSYILSYLNTLSLN